MRPATDDPDWYTLLGVPADATETQILRAFRRAALVHHPDRGGDADRFRLLYRARETLLDPSRRAAHDRRRRGTGTAQRDSPRYPSSGPDSSGPDSPSAPDERVADPFEWTAGAGPGGEDTSSRSAAAQSRRDPFAAAGTGYSWRRSDRFAWWRAG
ncbi:J domain-containing protein [Micromonospora radicis]|uniref:J domain-containing protein n=1 Tax=Micromonospora radicis TaxID=1894971 RepID=A0A418MX76_9ACTN|nr:DnaJ domain-containing protein [Micromonospora radicis]RIV39192.1 J domain-containing protein [Micromonospora radicis]